MLLPGSKDLVVSHLSPQSQGLQFVGMVTGDTATRELGRVIRGETAVPSNPELLVSHTTWAPPSQTIDSLLFERRGLVPRSERLRVRGRDITLHFNGERITGTVIKSDSGAREVSFALPEAPFAFNQLTVIVRSLPFREGYHVVVPLFSEMDERVEYDTLLVEGRVRRERQTLWRVRFADPVIVSTYLIDAVSRQVVSEEVVNRRNPTRPMRYVPGRLAGPTG